MTDSWRAVAGGNGTPRGAGSRCLALLLAVVAGAASAGNFSVSPVHLTLPATSRSTSLSVTSAEDRPLALRVQLYAWTKSEGVDRLTPTRELVVTPPILRLDPRKSRVVRIGRPAGVPVPDTETAYRVVVSEVPVHDGAAGGGARLHTVLDISVPLFVPPARQVRSLHWRLFVTPAGELVASVVNTGTVHSKVTRLRVARPDEETVTERTQLFYTLPGQEARVPLAPAQAIAPGEAVRLHYEADHAWRRSDLMVAAEPPR